MLKVKVHTLDIAPLCSESPCTAEALRYGTCSQGISQFYLHTHTFIRNRHKPYACLCLPGAIAGTHLPTPEGWKAELAWVAGYVVRVSLLEGSHHPRTNRAQCSATVLIEPNTLQLH